MNVKTKIKHLLGYLRCKVAGVNNRGRGVYVGRHVHFTNGKNICLGNNVQIRPDVDLFADSKMVIGDNCDIGARNRICGNIQIEASVLFGPDNYLSSVDHVYRDIDVPVMNQGAETISKNGHSELFIGEGSWIGTHVAIIGCVHIGRHCVIGANAVVLKDIPDYCVVAGNPARIVKKFSFDEKKWMAVKGE